MPRNLAWYYNNNSFVLVLNFVYASCLKSRQKVTVVLDIILHHMQFMSTYGRCMSNYIRAELLWVMI